MEPEYDSTQFFLVQRLGKRIVPVQPGSASHLEVPLLFAGRVGPIAQESGPSTQPFLYNFLSSVSAQIDICPRPCEWLDTNH